MKTGVRIYQDGVRICEDWSDDYMKTGVRVCEDRVRIM